MAVSSRPFRIARNSRLTCSNLLLVFVCESSIIWPQYKKLRAVHGIDDPASSTHLLERFGILVDLVFLAHDFFQDPAILFLGFLELDIP